MNMTWIDVVDSAVKIGLGALIGGAVGIFSPFVLARKEVILDKRSRRLKHIEETNMMLQEYSIFILQHAANTSFYWTCYYDKLPELADAKKDFDKDKNNYDAKQGLSIAATARLRLLGYKDLANKLRDLSDMMHAGLNQLGEKMSSEKREKLFYDLRKRFSEVADSFFEDFRKQYEAEPELKKLWGAR